MGGAPGPFTGTAGAAVVTDLVLLADLTAGASAAASVLERAVDTVWCVVLSVVLTVEAATGLLYLPYAGFVFTGLE